MADPAAVVPAAGCCGHYPCDDGCDTGHDEPPPSPPCAECARLQCQGYSIYCPPGCRCGDDPGYHRCRECRRLQNLGYFIACPDCDRHSPVKPLPPPSPACVSCARLQCEGRFIECAPGCSCQEIFRLPLRR